jgi:hypothetical protein
LGERTKARLEVFLKPPGPLLARVRWIFLLASLLMVFFQIYMILTVDVVVWPVRALGITSLLWLYWWWDRGYRRASFPSVSFLFESVAIFVVALAIGSPPFSLGLIYVSLIFRSLYGSWRAFLAILIGYLVAFYGAVAVSLTLLEGFAVPLWLVLPEGIGLIMISTVLHMLATVLEKHERAISRERILSEAGVKLVSTLNREGIYQATLDAALELVEGTPEARIGLATGSEEGMTVVAAAGSHAAEIRGDRFNVRTLVAEGVENDYQLQQLRELVCDQAQGYYFSRPLPSQEMSAKLGLDPESNHSSLPN